MGLGTLLAANGIVSRSEDQATVRLRIRSDSGLSSANGPHEPFEAAAQSFRQFLQLQENPDGMTLDNWYAAFTGEREHAQLLRDLHLRDPEAAQRLAFAMTNMPAVGSLFAGFHLLAELGRGAFGRVYLAEQQDLANRHVVVKVAADIWGEADVLAQLQHPHIVPIYSVHHRDPFQVVCMPFCGSTTLQSVLDEIATRHELPTSGRALLRTFNLASAETSAALAEATAQAETLAQLNYVDAIVWLAAQLADGLDHAHRRGILHRDLKPANILLTDDGQPLLLDFNVAEDTKQHASATLAWLAGTLPYMAPEQLGGFVGRATTPNARADLYSFGVLMFELLTARLPYSARAPLNDDLYQQILAERRMPPHQLRRLNPAVSPALEAIVLRCLQLDPEHRYPNARALHEDLLRQHRHLPLVHTSEPSRRERLRKWKRRHPRLFSGLLAGGAAVVLFTIVSVFALGRSRELHEIRQRQSEQQRLQKERDAAQSAWRQFREEAQTARFLLYTRTNEPQQLELGNALGLRLLAIYGVLDNSDWQQTPLVQALDPAEQTRLFETTSELLLLLARAHRLRHHDNPANSDRQAPLLKALFMNECAEACSPKTAISPGLWQQRGELASLLGRIDLAADSLTYAGHLPLQTAWDHYWLASDHVAAGRLREALPLLQKATHREPRNFWGWFVLAIAFERLGQDRRAEGAYGACIALAPDFAWAHFNRGLALLRQQEYQPACADFDEFLRLRPDDADGYLNRALARQGLGKLADAEDDLTHAIDSGGAATRLYFLRARVRDQRNDKEGAQRDFEQGFRQPPTDELSWLARGFARMSRDPKGALDDFEEALRLNPRSAAALQNKAHVLAEQLGQPKAALEVLDRALELYPHSPQVRGGRGVLFARLGRRDEALRDAEQTLADDASPPRLYQVACIYALTARQNADDQPRALQLLSAALSSGYGLQLLETDSDLDPIRNQPDFRRLVEAARTLRPTPAAVQIKKS